MRYAALCLMLLLAGCVTQPAPRGATITTAPLLADTPFFPQQAHQCGPAALATVLVEAGVATTPDELAQRVYLPERQGSLQAEMIAATRRLGRVPYPLQPQLAAIAREVAAGHPVLVLQNLALRSWPRWHYAVVIGVEQDRIVLRSGVKAEQRMRFSTFLRTWRYADSWAFVALRPGQMPASADARAWLDTYAAFEQTGEPAIASAGYEAGVQHWPDDARLWFAAGNARYGRGELRAATEAYRRATELDPSLPEPWNNLAQTLVDQQCRKSATAALRQARLHSNDSVRAAIADTEAALSRLPQSDAAGC
ncbi:MAG: PA2778 family cysteine peptidase [Steroidobacteraceae bacterium]